MLVSEVMLQQTQVSRVEPHYRAFLEAFPSPRDCARAGAAEIIRRWDGLGYNRRALNLHATAVRIVERHGGRVPDSLDALTDLPGVGDYTARAVLVFAFERDHGVVDTNASRVLARAVAGRRLTRTEAQSLADRLVPEGRAWEHNQAVLDFAAAFCTRREPACGECPVVTDCSWARVGWPGPDPAERSAGASGRQSRFEGSDRQARGRLVRALRTGPVPVDRVPDAAGWPDDPERAHRIADGLAAEGLAEYVDGALTLPS